MKFALKFASIEMGIACFMLFFAIKEGGPIHPGAPLSLLSLGPRAGRFSSSSSPVRSPA
jgi:hypothetical protein